MAGILDLVSQSLGGNTLQAISQRLGADPGQTQNAIGAALPLLLAGLAHRAGTEGAQAVHAAVSAHDGSALDNPVAAIANSATAATATDALPQALGQHQELAQGAVAGASGLDSGQAGQLLAMLAPLVMGAIGRVTRQQGLDPNGLASLLQGEHQQVSQTLAQSQPGLMGLASQLLDRNHDGNLMDDLGKGLGGLLGGR